MGMVTTLVRTVSDDPTPVTVDDVLVRVYTAAGAFVTEGLTGTLNPGEVEFTLSGAPAGTDYLLRLSKTGFSFPPAPTKTINVKDPAVPPNEFEFSSHEGATAVVATFVTKDDQQPTPADLTAVKISVYDSADQFLTDVETDSSGEVEVPLPGAPSPGVEYIVRLRKTGVTFPAGPTQRIQVLDPLPIGATNIFDFTGHIPTIPESADDLFCTLSGYLADIFGRPWANKTVVFHARAGFPQEVVGGSSFPGDPSLVDRRMLVADASTKTDANGYLEISLPRNGLYDVHIYGLEDPGNVIFPIVVPNAAGWKIEDVFFPYIKQITYDPSSLTMDVGDTALVSITAILSSGQSLVTDPDFDLLLQITSTDSTVATATLFAGAITIVALKAGTTTVNIARLPGTVAPRSPEVADIIVTPLVIGVV